MEQSRGQAQIDHNDEKRADDSDFKSAKVHACPQNLE